MKLSRRQLFKLMGVASSAAFAPRILLADDTTPETDDVVLIIYQRGAADGLSIVPPHGDNDYYKLRPTLAVPKPDSGQEDAALDLDGFFGFHPAMAPLLPAYHAGELAVIHAAGSPNPSHSHFQAQSLMERGLSEPTQINTGWFGRYLNYTSTSNDPVFRSVSMGNAAAASLRHDQSAIAMNSIETFNLSVADKQQAEIQQMLLNIYNSQNMLDINSANTIAAIQMLTDADPTQYEAENGAQYPDSNFGQQLMEIGQLIRTGIGLQAATIDISGWDTHEGQITTLNAQVADFAQGIAAFNTDMGELMSGITVITMTEFGRRAYENGSAGTDHGHASFMLAIGKNVNGGKVYHDWPTLADDALYESGDLEVTTDYRTVLAELIDTRTSGMPLDLLFPEEYSTDFLGVFKS